METSSQFLRHKYRRRLILETLCPEARHCSTPEEQNVPGRENSTTNNHNDAPIENEEASLSSCNVNEEGNFGSGTQTQQISFRYQVQTVLNQTVNRMEEEVLFHLEKEITQQLLSDMLSGSLCLTGSIAVQNATNNESRLSEEQPEDGASVSGIFAEPMDFIVPGVEGVRCHTELVENARRCFIVAGAFTLLSQNNSLPLNWTIPHALESAQRVIESGLLNSVHPDVLDVSYIEESQDDLVPVDDNVDFSPTTEPRLDTMAISEDRKMEPWSWVLVSLGVLGVVMAIFVVRRRRRR